MTTTSEDIVPYITGETQSGKSDISESDQPSPTETDRLVNLEATIERGLQTFVEVGNALMEIRDSKLYRFGHTTFEDYCRERWGMGRNYVNKIISASEVINNLGTIVPILPANEAQVRPLTKLSSEQQLAVWPLVVESAPNGKITAAHVQKAVDEYTQADHQEFDYDSHLDAALADEDRPVCPKCGQVYDGPRCPDCNPPNYKRDTQRSTMSDPYTPQGMDACQSPAYAIDPLLPYLPREWAIWEPAAGENNLVDALFDSGFSKVVASDILTGQNFFDFEPDNWDCIVTNPPFSIQLQWLERCYELGQPFALLLKVDVLGNKGNQELFDRHGVEVIFVNPRINFKMPYKGWDGGGAQFATAWFTCGLNIGQQMIFRRLKANGSSD